MACLHKYVHMIPVLYSKIVTQIGKKQGEKEQEKIVWVLSISHRRVFAMDTTEDWVEKPG